MTTARSNNNDQGQAEGAHRHVTNAVAAARTRAARIHEQDACLGLPPRRHSTSCLGAYTAAARDARRLRHRRLATTVCRNKREISSKLNLDLDLGQVLGTVKRNEGLYDNLLPARLAYSAW